MGEENKPQTQKSTPDQVSVTGDEKREKPETKLPKKLEGATRHYERAGSDPDWGQH